MDNQIWLDSVKTSFEFLFLDYGFSLTSSDYHEESFGNRISILESEKYIIRVVLDRGQLTVRIIPKFDVEFGIYLTSLVEFLTNSRFPDVYAKPPQIQLSKRAKLFKDYSEEIFSFFDSSLWNEKKDKIRKYYLQRLEEENN